MLIENPTRSLCFVYAIRLTYDPSQEIRYVGLSSRGDKRIKDHLRTYNRPSYKSYDKALYRWIRKHYGQVTFEVLEECSKEDLLLVEMKWISIIKSRGHRLFNATEGGDGFATYVPTPEHRKKMAENLPRYPAGPGHPCYGRPGTGKGMLGKTHSAETKRKIGVKHAGKTLSDEHKRKISVSGKGKGGRDTSGERHPQARLTEADVINIRLLRADGASLKDLATRFGVTTTSISRICLRQSWVHI